MDRNKKMKFSNIDSKLSSDNVDAATIRFNSLILDLSLRDTAFVTGTKCGGNKLQFLVLLELPNSLVGEGKIVASSEGISWGCEYLASTPIKQIRSDLNEMFEDIRKYHPSTFIKMESFFLISGDQFFMSEVLNPKLFKEAFESRQEEFKKVHEVVKNFNCVEAASFSPFEQLVAANLLCINLAEQLDNKDFSNLDKTSNVLSVFMEGIIAWSVRQYIGVMRMIDIEDLDLHLQEPFNSLIKRVKDKEAILLQQATE